MPTSCLVFIMGGRIGFTVSDENFLRRQVDQPVGTGYSYADPPSYMHTETEIGSAFLNFMKNFMEAFPEYRRSEVSGDIWKSVQANVNRFVQLYIAGESFAGIYIPYIANAAISWNEQQDLESKVGSLYLFRCWPVSTSFFRS